MCVCVCSKNSLKPQKVKVLVSNINSIIIKVHHRLRKTSQFQRKQIKFAAESKNTKKSRYRKPTLTRFPFLLLLHTRSIAAELGKSLSGRRGRHWINRVHIIRLVNGILIKQVMRGDVHGRGGHLAAHHRRRVAVHEHLARERASIRTTIATHLRIGSLRLRHVRLVMRKIGGEICRVVSSARRHHRVVMVAIVALMQTQIVSIRVHAVVGLIGAVGKAHRKGVMHLMVVGHIHVALGRILLLLVLVLRRVVVAQIRHIGRTHVARDLLLLLLLMVLMMLVISVHR